MTRSKLHQCFTNGASPALLAFVCAALGAACSAEYPLGDLSHGDLPLSGGASVAAARVPDHTISPLLAAPDVTMTLDEGIEIFASPSTIANVGDLDGDGFPEVAVFARDDATGLSFVQLRYGAARLSDPLDQLGWRESGAILALNGGLSIGQVNTAGDVDGDGYADLMVSTGNCLPTQADEGVYLVYGGPLRLEGAHRLGDVGVRFVPPQRINPNEDGSIRCGGNGGPVAADVDGDGLSDLVFVEPPNYDGQRHLLPDPGTEGVYVFYGSTHRFESDTSWAQADAHLSTAGDLTVSSFRDANGDGSMDLLVGWPNPGLPTQSPTYWLAGSSQRLNGTLPLASVGTELRGAFPPSVDATGWFSDLDGDGLSDVLLQDASRRSYLFYGAPALFHDGVDLAAADATFAVNAPAQPIGDRDGDGDGELLWTVPSEGGTTGFEVGFGFSSGRRERLSGEVAVPSEVAANPSAVPHFDDPQRVEFPIFPAGDLDGDGTIDLFGYSVQYIRMPNGQGETLSNPELHIHYGTPAGATLQDTPH